MPGFSQVLDFFKARGLFPEQMGVDLEPFITREFAAATALPIANGASSNSLFQVPASENWRVFLFHVDITQGGGAAAMTNMRFQAGPTGTRVRIPMLFRDQLGPTVEQDGTLNQVHRIALLFPPEGLMLPPLSGIRYDQSAGDGTITAAFGMYFQRIQSNQVIQF